jgi:IS30 family transposase
VAIARALGRAKTAISRELQRNALSSGGYSPLHAAGAYQLHRRREAILEREAALPYLTRRHKRRRLRRARASRDTIKDRATIHERPKTLKAAARPAIGGQPHHLQTHTACARGDDVESALGFFKASSGFYPDFGQLCAQRVIEAFRYR